MDDKDSSSLTSNELKTDENMGKSVTEDVPSTVNLKKNDEEKRPVAKENLKEDSATSSNSGNDFIDSTAKKVGKLSLNDDPEDHSVSDGNSKNGSTTSSDLKKYHIGRGHKVGKLSLNDDPEDHSISDGNSKDGSATSSDLKKYYIGRGHKEVFQERKNFVSYSSSRVSNDRSSWENNGVSKSSYGQSLSDRDRRRCIDQSNWRNKNVGKLSLNDDPEDHSVSDGNSKDGSATSWDLKKYHTERWHKEVCQKERKNFSSYSSSRVSNGKNSWANNETSPELPSHILDREILWYPSESVCRDEVPLQGGKWMLFNGRNLKKLDRYWTGLTRLCREMPAIVGLKSATAAIKTGCIRAYTRDFENKEEVKMVGDAIMKATGYDDLMYYKTNQASAQGEYVRLGHKNVTSYKHDGYNFFVRDTDGWVQWP